MPLELPLIWIVSLNVTLWPVIQIALAWGFIRMPAAWFDAPDRPFHFETRGFYERGFGVKHWKDLLPDGARWFGGGFAKNELAARDERYLQEFIRETRRGELCHGCAFLFVPIFFLWNPWWGNLVIVAYVILANLPCIIAQRYNRIRLRRLLARVNRISTHE
jgi:glycosyl-4,4'-diaponeurosporenoate acyltransferase